jgi:hypothetical protein
MLHYYYLCLCYDSKKGLSVVCWNGEVAIEIAATKVKACGQLNCSWYKDRMEGRLKRG